VLEIQTVSDQYELASIVLSELKVEKREMGEVYEMGGRVSTSFG